MRSVRCELLRTKTIKKSLKLFYSNEYCNFTFRYNLLLAQSNINESRKIGKTFVNPNKKVIRSKIHIRLLTLQATAQQKHSNEKYYRLHIDNEHHIPRTHCITPTNLDVFVYVCICT